jgi:hypothetical protein
MEMMWTFRFPRSGIASTLGMQPGRPSLPVVRAADRDGVSGPQVTARPGRSGWPASVSFPRRRTTVTRTGPGSLRRVQPNLRRSALRVQVPRRDCVAPAGAYVQAVVRRLDGAAAAIAGRHTFTFTPWDPVPETQTIKDLKLLPLALCAFPALLAVSAVGNALSTVVRRRCHDLAALRALGMTRRPARLVVTTQASLLAAIGLLFGSAARDRHRPGHLAHGGRLHPAGLPSAARPAGSVPGRPGRPDGRERPAWPHQLAAACTPDRSCASSNGSPRPLNR